jgi:hypothetical protein
VKSVKKVTVRHKMKAPLGCHISHNIYHTCLFYNNNVVVQNTWRFMLNVLGSFSLNFVG